MTGCAGEHYVMYRLLQQGFIAALAPENAPDIDILVSDEAGQTLSAIQVKTSGSKVTEGWMMSARQETLVRQSLFYCFICPGDGSSQPTCWLVPSAVVAEHVSSTHRAWLSDKSARRHRNDSDRRKFHIIQKSPPMAQYGDGWLNHYREAWQLLRTA